jgi:hypothetical protein
VSIVDCDSKGLGEGIKRRFILLQFDGFQVKVEIVDVGALTNQGLVWGPLLLQSL